MKRSFPAFLAAFLLLLSGCAELPPAAAPAPPQTAAQETLTEPSKLTVIHNETAIEALKGGFSWTVFRKDGTAVSTEADSAHPLQCQDITPVLPLKPSPLSHVDPFAVYLEFETAPHTVRARCWSTECWGRDDAGSTEAAVEAMDSADGTDNTVWVLRLTGEDTICEVTAEWDVPGQYRGKGTYIFCTEAITLELHPIEES